MKDFKLIRAYLKGSRLKLLGLSMVVILSVILTLIAPLLFRFLIDNVVHGLEIKETWLILYSNLFGGVDIIREHLWLGALMIIFVNLGMAYFMYLRGRWNGEISETFVEKLRNDLFYHLQRWPYPTHVNANTGDLIQRCTSDVDTIRRFLSGQLAELVYAFTIALIATSVLFTIYPPLAWMALISLPIIVVLRISSFSKCKKSLPRVMKQKGIYRLLSKRI